MLSSPHTERALLGAILLDNGAYHEAIASLQPGDLSLPAHQIIFAGITRMIEKGKACDISTLPEELRRTNELETVGGYPYLCDLTNDVPRRPSIADYVATLREKAARKELGQLGESLVGYSLDSDLDADAILDAAEGRLLEIRGGRDSEDFSSTEDGVAELLRQMEEERNRPTDLLGLPSGIPALDRQTRGYQRGELTVCGAASGVGKTSLMVQAAIANAGQGVPTLLFSLEMTKAQLLRRVLSAVSGVPFQRVRDARWASAEDLDNLRRTALEVATWPLHIEDASGSSSRR
jgi:replicative DNA helicase